MLGTSIRAIAAGRTGNQMLAPENLLHTSNRFQFLFIQRLEVRHKRNIILHLLHIAHTG